jgi:hypothetical protein
VPRIILHYGIANRHELFDPYDNFLDHVPKDDNFAVAFLERPAFLYTNLLFLLSDFEGSRDYVTMSSFPEVETGLELFIQRLKGFVPKTP